MGPSVGLGPRPDVVGPVDVVHPTGRTRRGHDRSVTLWFQRSFIWKCFVCTITGVAERVAISFPPFLISPEVDVLYRDGNVVPLQPHAVRLLRYLAENRDRVVSKNELLDRIWADTFTTDGVLKKAVLQARRALGDSAEDARFIETHHARGYRFIANIVSLPDADPPKPLLASNLPHFATTFVGREEQIANIRRALAAARLVTLVGTGGLGKTRLAVEVAHRLHGDSSDEVWLVELAPVADGLQVAQAVANALGVSSESNGAPTQALCEYLRARRAVLVLDNCEHVIDACAAIANTLLSACPGLRILAASREALSIAGESIQSVPVLSLPTTDTRQTVESIRGSEAASLFADRARLCNPDFTVSDANAPAVADICRRLDGIALAIELAAARMRWLSVEQIASRIDGSFGLLGAYDRTAPARQRTLEATIDWSYDSLTEEEREALRALSVFAGGWTLEAAEGILGADALGVLGRLVDKSLVVATVRDGAARYAMLETIRHYALQKLQDTDEEPGVVRRHRDWFVEWAERLGDDLRGADQDARISRLKDERENLRAVFRRGLEKDDAAGACIRLGAAIGVFWGRLGYGAEGRRWLETALERDSTPTVARGRALGCVGLYLTYESEFVRAESTLEEAAAIQRSLGDHVGLCQTLLWLGSARLLLGNDVAGEAAEEESLALARGVGDFRVMSSALIYLAHIAKQRGDFDRAEACWRRAFASRADTAANARWLRLFVTSAVSCTIVATWSVRRCT